MQRGLVSHRRWRSPPVRIGYRWGTKPLGRLQREERSLPKRAMPRVEGLRGAQNRQDNSGNRRRRKWCLLSRAGPAPSLCAGHPENAAPLFPASPPPAQKPVQPGPRKPKRVLLHRPGLSQRGAGPHHDCGAVRRFPNRCDQFFCPECQPRLTRVASSTCGRMKSKFLSVQFKVSARKRRCNSHYSLLSQSAQSIIPVSRGQATD